MDSQFAILIYRCTLPDASPFIKSFTSLRVIWFKSPEIVCFNALATHSKFYCFRHWHTCNQSVNQTTGKAKLSPPLTMYCVPTP